VATGIFAEIGRKYRKRREFEPKSLSVHTMALVGHHRLYLIKIFSLRLLKRLSLYLVNILK
jgi:hypothetical protein